jgi:hypothetical protein
MDTKDSVRVENRGIAGAPDIPHRQRQNGTEGILGLSSIYIDSCRLMAIPFEIISYNQI